MMPVLIMQDMVLSLRVVHSIYWINTGDINVLLSIVVISQKGMVVINTIAITWLFAQSNKSSYLEGQREG